MARSLFVFYLLSLNEFTFLKARGLFDIQQLITSSNVMLDNRSVVCALHKSSTAILFHLQHFE
jgi:hypothetical protein